MTSHFKKLCFEKSKQTLYQTSFWIGDTKIIHTLKVYNEGPVYYQQKGVSLYLYGAGLSHLI